MRGHRLYAPLNGSTSTHLVDDRGVIVNTWASSFPVGISSYMRSNGNLVRTIQTSVAGNGSGGGVQEMKLDGTLVWDFRYDRPGVKAHHDIELMPNGNVLMIAWESKTAAEAVAAGRAGAIGTTFRPDHIVEVRPTGPTTGDIVWEWHVWDHLVQDHDPNAGNYGDVGANWRRIDINYPPTGSPNDFNHINSVSYDPINDWVILCTPAQNECWIIDHSTTTAEAAGSTGGRWGHGGDLLYRWGNPLAHRAGTAADQKLIFPHSIKRIPPGYPGAGNLTVFNNRANPMSEVWEIVLPLDAAGNFVQNPDRTFGPTGPVWRYADPNFDSFLMSSCERLRNGNTLICSTMQGRVFEVTPAGTNVFEHVVAGGFIGAFNATFVPLSLWESDTEVSTVTGGTIEFDLIAGTRHAGRTYYLAGSLAGTNPGIPLGGGLTLPLNVDEYLLNATGTSLLPNSIGTIAANGRADASFVLPAGVGTALSGLKIDHAYLVVDPSTLTIHHVSNPVSVQLR